MKSIFAFLPILLSFVISSSALCQEPSKIVIEHSDYADSDQEKLPDVFLLTGNVRVSHEGVVITCNKAYYFKIENIIKALGDVQMVQGDTLFLNSKFADYNGNTKLAFANGKAVMRSPDATLYTDTIHFDRNTQEAYYNTHGKIINKENTLVSKSGRYFALQKKFLFLTAVTITNPTVVIKSNHLDYFSNSGHSYLFGPSTITSKSNYIYTENGFYDTKKNLSHFLRKSYIRYKDRLIEGDSLYYDRNREFASATRNVKITDSINKGIVRGHYGEVFKLKDSMFVIKRAVALNYSEPDTLYIHGKKLLVTGKTDDRILRAFTNVRIYRTNMSGKCDSIHSSTKMGLTKMIKDPILWNGESQITGEVMHLIADKRNNVLDSLKVINNTFLIEKDSLGTGYNQTKGQLLNGKFRDSKLRDVDIIKNAEVLYYMRNEFGELTGINKSNCSKINLLLANNAIETITFIDMADGEIHPDGELKEEDIKLKGFIWRSDERIHTLDELFPPEENLYGEQMKKAAATENAKENKPMKVRKETLDYDKNNK